MIQQAEKNVIDNCNGQQMAQINVSHAIELLQHLPPVLLSR